MDRCDSCLLIEKIRLLLDLVEIGNLLKALEVFLFDIAKGTLDLSFSPGGIHVSVPFLSFEVSLGSIVLKSVSISRPDFFLHHFCLLRRQLLDLFAGKLTA